MQTNTDFWTIAISTFLAQKSWKLTISYRDVFSVIWPKINKFRNFITWVSDSNDVKYCYTIGFVIVDDWVDRFWEGTSWTECYSSCYELQWLWYWRCPGAKQSLTRQGVCLVNNILYYEIWYHLTIKSLWSTQYDEIIHTCWYFVDLADALYTEIRRGYWRDMLIRRMIRWWVQ